MNHQFRLDHFTEVEVLHINKRKEKHGDEWVHAKDIRCRITVPNTSLDAWFGAGLRQAIYMATDTETLPDVEPATPLLRTSLLKGPHPIKKTKDIAGARVVVDRGLGDEKSNITLDGCDINKQAVDPKEGGSVDVYFRIQVSGLDMETMGRLDEMDGRSMPMTITPAELQDGTLPDSVPTTHEGEGPLFDGKDATDEFLDQHGDGGEAEKAPDEKAPTTNRTPLAKKIAQAERRAKAKAK